MNNLLTEVSVLMTMGWAATLYISAQKRLRQQQAWQWWHQQQILQQHHQAEAIRDGLLQQTFAFRRYLDAQASSAATTAADTDLWAKRFQTFYTSLETLSNELSPPFLTDSLPLALQYAVKEWQRLRPDLQVQFDLPAEWEADPDKNQTVLSVALLLLDQLVPEGARSLHVSLQPGHQLTFTVQPTAQQFTHSRSELQHLKEIFRSLAAGELESSHSGGSLVGRLRWQG